MDRWQNRVAVVTGASSGIGAACANYLVENGMNVVGLARRQARVEALRDALKPEQRSRLHAIQCDVSDEQQVVSVFKQIESDYGPVAVLVNNAGVGCYTELVKDNNSADIRATIDTNVLGVVWCTREAFRSMKAHGGDGHVININSITGHKVVYSENRSLNIYPASKHAITAMTEVYRQEFLRNKTKVKVTSISPGFVDTEILSDEMRKLLPNNAPMLESGDVADAVIYCLQTPPRVQIHELTIKPMGEKC